MAIGGTKFFFALLVGVVVVVVDVEGGLDVIEEEEVDNVVGDRRGEITPFSRSGGDEEEEIGSAAFPRS